ncbi:MAG: pilus assembly protein, partial [Rubrivivax sp.]
MNNPSNGFSTVLVARVARQPRRIGANAAGTALGLLIAWGVAATAAHATTSLADQPVFSNITVPGNLALALSVEFPTVVSVAHTASTYSNIAQAYLGYFDPEKCYGYFYSAVETQRHFYPTGSATNRSCDGSKWSGNFLNWATMQTIDPFRWVLTGGYRVVDTPTVTILEKGHASGQGGASNFPNRTVNGAALINNVTPAVAWSAFAMRVQGLGNKMRFSDGVNVDTGTIAYQGGALLAGQAYELSVRVKVCDQSPGAGPLEANCTAYPADNYKPTGLMQKYAEKIRYSAFGYLNDSNVQRDGGVLRAKQKFVGPTMTVPGLPLQPNTDAPEWSSLDGTFFQNPNVGDAFAFGTAVNHSGVINYLNKFGQITPGNFKTYDPVGELYYAALRYYKNQGNV